MKKSLFSLARLFAAFLLCGTAQAQLTPGTNNSIGSAVGQMPTSQPASRNLLVNTALPVAGGSGNWTLNGSATLTAQFQNQFDAGFTPVTIASTHGTTDFVQSGTLSITASKTYTFSAYISVDPLSPRHRRLRQP